MDKEQIIEKLWDREEQRGTILRSDAIKLVVEIERLRTSLKWYRDEAKALAKNMAGGAHAAGVLASVMVLSLDAGQRADVALGPNV